MPVTPLGRAMRDLANEIVGNTVFDQPVDVRLTFVRAEDLLRQGADAIDALNRRMLCARTFARSILVQLGAAEFRDREDVLSRNANQETIMPTKGNG